MDVFGSRQQIPVSSFKIDTEKKLLAMMGGYDVGMLRLIIPNVRHSKHSNLGGLVVHPLQDPKWPVLFELLEVTKHS